LEEKRLSCQVIRVRQRWRLRGRAATFDYFPSEYYCIPATCNYLNIRNKKTRIAPRKSSRHREERTVFWKVRDVTRWRKEAATNFKILPLWPATRPASCVCGTSSMNSCRHQTGSITRLPFLFFGGGEKTPFRSRFAASGLGTRLPC
jgi:hypothetical protein